MAHRARKTSRGPEQIAGIHAALEAIRAGRRVLHVLRVRGGKPRAGVDREGPTTDPVVEAARAAGLRVERVSADQLTALAGSDANHQGVVLEAGPLPEAPLEALAELGVDGCRVLVALDGVEDPQNLGAIARVAEAAGAGGLILTQRRSPPLSPAVARASAGAIEWLPCARVPNLPRALDELKSRDFWIFGSGPEAAVDLFDLPDRVVAGNRVVVLGAEGRGMRRGVDRVLDFKIRIPLGGHVESLNVSAAAAVVLFELKRRSHLRETAALATSV